MSSRFSASSRGGQGGTFIGPYQVLRELGRGGMGVVLEAVDASGQHVAVKVMTSGAPTLKRFERETQALAALDHPNVVRFRGAGPGPPPWLAMDYVEGEDLDARLEEVLRRAIAGKSAALPHEESAQILSQIALGVAYAHAQGIVHRDLKPANVLLRASDGVALVTDFGLARSLDASRFTKTGAALGTFAYMSPEQAQGQGAGFPSDVWALGVILYRCLTGEAPFNAPSSMALITEITRGDVLRPRARVKDTPSDLESVCMSCLQQDPSARPTAREVAEALAQRRPLLPLPSLHKPKLLFALGAGGALALLAALVVAAGFALASGEPALSQTPALASASPTLQPSASQGPEPGSVRAPWPAPTWPLLWRANERGPVGSVGARLEPPALWKDARGRVAAPLAPLNAAKEGESVPGFLGPARALGGGRVEVGYPDLARALFVDLCSPADYFDLCTHGHHAVPRPEARGVTLSASDNTTGFDVTIGGAQWAEAALALDLRETKRIDLRALQVTLGDRPVGASDASLNFLGRSGRLGLGKTKVQLSLGPAWKRLVFAPGAAPGQRIRLGDQAVARLDAVAAEPARPGRVRLALKEIELGVADVVLKGRPLQSERPALAWLPDELAGPAHLAVSFRSAAAASSGGALLGFGLDEREGHWLELDGARVVLRRGRNVLAEGLLARPPAANARGWATLQREADLLEARVSLGAEASLVLRACDPLPFRGATRACYGSTGPTLRFERVELRAGPADGERVAFEAAAGAERGELESPPTARTRWWFAALRLARVSRLQWAEPRFVGAGRREARHAEAAEVGAELERVAQETSGQRQRSCLAHAVLAYVTAGQEAGGVRAAQALVKAAGLKPAQEALEALHTRRWRGSFLKRLSLGYGTIIDPSVRETALRVALIVAPEEEGRLLYLIAQGVRTRTPRVDPKTQEGRGKYEEALLLLGRARKAGYEKTLELDSQEAQLHMDLGRYDEALARYERLVLRRLFWFDWQQLANCQVTLGRTVDALVSAFGCAALVPQRTATRDLLVSQLRRAQVREAPGLIALCALFLSEQQRDPQLRAQALKVAASAVGSPGVQGDLAAYVLVRAGQPAPERSGGGPALLARAHSGDEKARGALREAAKGEALLRAVCLSDPELEPLVR